MIIIKYLILKPRNILFSLIIAMLTLILFFQSTSIAQDEPTLKDLAEGKPKVEDTKKEDETGKDSYGKQAVTDTKQVVTIDKFKRDTPLTTVEGFLSATSERDYENAANYLRLTKLSKGFDTSDGPELARMLRILINQKLWINLDQLNIDPKGNLDDGLPAHLEFISSIETPEGNKNVYLRRYSDSAGNYMWYFSADTVREIPYLYSLFGYGHLGDLLSDFFGDISIWGIQIWQIIGILLLFIVGYIISFIFTSLIAHLIRKKDHPVVNSVLELLTRPIRLILTLIIASFGIEILSPGVSLRALLKTKTFLIIVVIWFCFKFVDILALLYRKRLESQGKYKLIAIIRPIGTTFKVLIFVMFILMWLNNVGFQITTVLAGIGIGGLALALGAQKTIEDIFGAITIFTSSPVDIGDFCRFGDRLGTVEEIGIRNTRIRTLDHSVISIPNSQFASMQIDNYSKKEKYWYHPTIRLKHKTTSDQIKKISSLVTTMLEDHPKVTKENIRVRFKDIGLISLDIEVFAYINVKDYNTFLEVGEELNFGIIEIISNAGGEFAVPLERYQT